MAVTVRRVLLHEWQKVRALRLEAVSDPDAAMAFLRTREEEEERPDAFWQQRTANAAMSQDSAQFIAEAGSRWVGSASVLLRRAGTLDHVGNRVAESRADIVGVFVAPTYRGQGLVGRLFDACGEWAAAHGHRDLTLDVHADNARAQAAYRKVGFEPTGVRFTSTIGPELQMRRVRHSDA